MNIKTIYSWEIFLTLFFLFSSSEVAASIIEKGDWKTVSEFNCSDILSFDGESLVTTKSGEQRVVEAYLITEVEKTVFFHMKTIVIENNGKPDCLKRKNSEIGHELNLYFRFNEDKSEIHLYLVPDESGYMELYLKRIN